MLICAAGDIHGAIDRLYQDVVGFENALSVRFEWVLHVGDFGVWPDPNRVDRATRDHDGAGDFPTWFAERRAVPRKTIFIKGNHEDFVWLDSQSNNEILPRLFYLKNGHAMVLGERDDAIRVGGIGGCFGPSDYERASTHLQGYAKRHYTRDEVEHLAEQRDLDIILTHDAPTGVRFEERPRRPETISTAMGLDHLLSRTQPQVCFFGHHHTRLNSEIAGVPCIGLNKVGRPGNLIAVEIGARGREWSVLGEWPTV